MHVPLTSAIVCVGAGGNRFGGRGGFGRGHMRGGGGHRGNRGGGGDGR